MIWLKLGKIAVLRVLMFMISKLLAQWIVSGMCNYWITYNSDGRKKSPCTFRESASPTVRPQLRGDRASGPADSGAVHMASRRRSSIGGDRARAKGGTVLPDWTVVAIAEGNAGIRTLVLGNTYL